MADYTLHCFLQSGNAYKPALMLQLAGADWEPAFVDFMNGGNRTPEFRALNEMGEVPVLIDHTIGDEVLTQSGVMLWHLAKRFTEFGPKGDADEREILRWMLWDNHKFTGNLATFRFMNKFIGKGDTPAAQFAKDRMIQAFKTLNRRLEGRDWVATGYPSIADISIFGYCTWPDHYDTDWADYPNIKAWKERMEALPRFATPEEIVPSSA